jgi:predicted alpha/beta superfamily hydrolase
MIIVGINNMGFNTRERDLTPTVDSKIAHSGGGDNFISFLEKELIPYIESRYPVANYRIYSGHSLGGLAVVNALLNHTALFNAYIALDPSLWWENQQWIKKYESELSHDFSNRSLFVGIANNIPPGLDTISVLKSNDPISTVTRAVIPFVHVIRDAKPVGLRWASKFYPNERHGTVELAAEYDALRYLFNYYQFRTSQFIGHPELDEDSVLSAHYKVISEKLGYTVLPTENTVNDMAYDCMGRHKMAQAYKLFIRNTKNHPESANAFDSLGDYYVAAGDKPKAIEAFTKSLTIQEVEDTRKKLNEIKK